MWVSNLSYIMLKSKTASSYSSFGKKAKVYKKKDFMKYNCLIRNYFIKYTI